jgi:hypothetical protein
VSRAQRQHRKRPIFQKNGFVSTLFFVLQHMKLTVFQARDSSASNKASAKFRLRITPMMEILGARAQDLVGRPTLG